MSDFKGMMQSMKENLFHKVDGQLHILLFPENLHPEKHCYNYDGEFVCLMKHAAQYIPAGNPQP